MAITRSTAARNAAVDAVVDLIDVGTTNPNGQLIIMAAGDVEVATLDFANPAFGAASSGTGTANAITGDSSATGGTAVAFKTVNRDGTEVYRGTVGTVGSGADLELTSTTIAATEPVNVSSLTYTAGA